MARVSAELSPEELPVNILSRGLAALVQDQQDRTQIEINGSVVNFELLDYSSGEHRFACDDRQPVELFGRKDGRERTKEIASTLGPSPASEILQTSPFGHLNYEPPDDGTGYGNASVKFTNDDEIVVRNAHIVIFDLPVNIKYWKGIVQSFNSARANLSGFSPSVAIVDIPASRWEKMKENERQYEGDRISETRRLEISMKGILKQNSGINGLVVTSRFVNRTAEGVEKGRFGETMIQRFPKEPLPTEVTSFIVDTLGQ